MNKGNVTPYIITHLAALGIDGVAGSLGHKRFLSDPVIVKKDNEIATKNNEANEWKAKYEEEHAKLKDLSKCKSILEQFALALNTNVGDLIDNPNWVYGILRKGIIFYALAENHDNGEFLKCFQKKYNNDTYCGPLSILKNEKSASSGNSMDYLCNGNFKFDNILGLFNDLSEGDKKYFLRLGIASMALCEGLISAYEPKDSDQNFKRCSDIIKPQEGFDS